MHAVLIAKALSLPAWMQLLHPVATVIAKTKLLVLPVYPAAWPQAKQHPAMQALIRFWNYLAAHYLARKTAYRYRQTETVAAHIGDALRHTAAATGLSRLGSAMLAGVNAAAAWSRKTTWDIDGPNRRDAVAVPDIRRRRAALHRALRRGEPRHHPPNSATRRADFSIAGRSSSPPSTTRTRNGRRGRERRGQRVARYAHHRTTSASPILTSAQRRAMAPRPSSIRCRSTAVTVRSSKSLP